MIDGKHYIREYVKCRKERCRGCPHGGYWYVYWRENRRLKKKYLGKDRPLQGQPWIEERMGKLVDERDDIFDERFRTEDLARRILGLSPGFTHLDLREKWVAIVNRLGVDGDRLSREHAFKKEAYLWLTQLFYERKENEPHARKRPGPKSVPKKRR